MQDLVRSIGSALLVLCGALPLPAASEVFAKVEHGFADSGGVKIHYATLGQGPLMIMIHGFPDFWYFWRHQMAALAEDYQVVAIDQRGYNQSDKPRGQEHYATRKLAADVKAVQNPFGADKSIIVGHDWGGVVSWTFAYMFPERVEQLIILNLPHPRGLSRELALSNERAPQGPMEPDRVARAAEHRSTCLRCNCAVEGSLHQSSSTSRTTSCEASCGLNSTMNICHSVKKIAATSGPTTKP